jgi:DNA repair protein RecO (recombination protein O)
VLFMAYIIKTRGIVLHTRVFLESSLIASLFTKQHGKITVLAKGIRRPKSKLCGTLERFNLDEIIFYKREFKEMYTLSDAEVIDRFEEIRVHPEKVAAAMVLCEFYNKTLPAEETDITSFTLLLEFLKRLQEVGMSVVKSLTFYYLLRALSKAGVRPHLDNCVRCHAVIKQDRKIDFSVAAGGVVCDKHFDDTVLFLNVHTLATLQQIYRGKNIDIDKNSEDEIQKLIPNYLYYHLNNLVLHSLKHLE